MKISYGWLKEYLDIDLPVDELSEILTAIGLEVGGVETFESIRGGLRGIVAGHVKTCSKHPNADRLTLCTVDVGNGDPLQIVCGAPNVAAGQKVWVAMVGTTLYPVNSEDGLAINKAKVRGESSEGMICAEDELGLGQDHSGILVLPEDIQVGTEAASYYEVESDTVYDIDLTPNRSDATSHLGVAEDVAAYLKINGDDSPQVQWPTSPDLDATKPSPISVEVRNTEACPRYAGVVIEGITVGESPDWLKKRLLAIGVRPINSVVDTTNFILHEMGQPLHAFDADLIADARVIVQTLPQGTKFVSLDEVERTLLDSDLMICDGQEKGMCIGGVFGGIGTGVTEGTSRIFLESAHFNPEWIRRSSMAHQLRTDAARTFEKTTDPNVCVTALKRAAGMISELAGGHVDSELVDIYPNAIKPNEVTVRWDHVDRLIGIDIPRQKVIDILAALNMKVIEQNDEAFRVAVPTNKADVTREADVIEEILRIFGFNNVPLQSQMEVALTSVEQPTLYKMRHTLGAMLSSLGFCEMMGLAMTEDRHFESGAMQLDPEHRVYIENTSNISLSLMRPNMMVTALEVAQYNQNRQQEQYRMYEFGNVYAQDKGKIDEHELLSLIMAGGEHPHNWRSPADGNVDFYVLKKYVKTVLDRVGIKRYQVSDLDDPRFEYGLKYSRGKEVIAEFGVVQKALRQQFDIRSEIMFAVLNVEVLFNAFGNQKINVNQISRFPGTTRDLAFVMPTTVQYADLERVIKKCDQTQLRSVELFDVYVNPEQLGEGRKSYAVQLTFEDLERTLTDEDVDATISSIVSAVEKNFDARQR